MTSREKVQQALTEASSHIPPAYQVLAQPMLARFPIPDDPAELDLKLENAARLLLQLRSDDAPTAVIVIAAPQPPDAHQLAAAAAQPQETS